MKKLINGLLLCITMLGCVAQAKVLPYISIRSQSENAARELVLWQTQINLSCMDEFYGSFSITPEYTRSFRDGRTGRLLFNDALNTSCCKNDCVTFNVQGSAVPNRDPKAWLADYFGLPLDYSSTVKVAPRIENIIADFNLYLGLDNWVQGLYFRIHAPVVNTRWNLGFCEKNVYAGIMNAPIGYYNSADNGDGSTTPFYGIERANLVGTFAGYISRCEIPTVTDVTFDKLTHARFGCRELKRTALSDIQMALGWNFWQSECYHFGLNIRGAAPTGTRPNGNYIFEPVVGNGKHWELGGGLTGHWTFWRSCDECHEFNVYLDANITHMFKAEQCRTLDLCGKPLSRYMLAAKMTPHVENLEGAGDGSAPVPSYQFDREFSSVANLSTIKVDVSATVQADIALKFAYSHNCFQMDFGYEFWARSCEKITPRHCGNSCNSNCCQLPAHEYWALKGDAFVYAYPHISLRALPDAVALSSSERDAQIFCGTNNYFRTGAYPWASNAGVDNAALAFSDEDNLINWVGGLINQPTNVFSSFDPYVFDTVDTTQWDFDGAQSRGITNKIFGNIGYVWKHDNCKDDCCIQWTPYLGLGGEVEFASHDKSCCTEVSTTCTTKTPAIAFGDVSRGGSCCGNNSSSNCCNNNTKCCKIDKCNKADKCCCIDGAISQWGVWIKGGVSFN